MERPCEACGKPMTVVRATKRFCSSTCRVRASQGTVVPFKPDPPSTSEHPLVVAIRGELEDVGRADSALGIDAILLAGRIASGQEPGSAVSGLNRELRATLAEATRGTVKSSVAAMRDELAARRRQA